MASKDEERAHLIRIDQYSLVQEEVGHHGREDLRAATDANSKYHLLIPDGWDGDSYTWWDFSDGIMEMYLTKLEKLYIVKSLTNTFFLER